MNIRYAAIALAFLCGCATYKVTDAPPLEHDFEAKSRMVESNGVALMAKPIHHEIELQRYFDDDPLKYGILPMQIRLENNHHDTAVICAAEGINLMDSTDARVPALSIDEVMDKVKKSHWRTAGWTVGFGVFGLIPSAINVNTINKKMRAHYEGKTFQGGEMAKGKALEGFLFYSMPESTDSLDGWKLAAALNSADWDADLVLTQELSGDISPRVEGSQAQRSQTLSE